jgi:hypothetical protein
VPEVGKQLLPSQLNGNKYKCVSQFDFNDTTIRGTSSKMSQTLQIYSIFYLLMFYLMMLVAAQDYTAFKSRMIGEI